MSKGPLDGVRVLELAGIGPVPYACSCLADLGADVIRVAPRGDHRAGSVFRGRPSWGADLKDAEQRRRTLLLADRADVLVEGLRPGATERLGLGPGVCTDRNPRLIYARLTGWGQHGPMSPRAGHDINYLGLTGALHSIGPADGKPAVPLNLVADYGGGAMFLVAGVLAALLERQRSGIGQVIDVAMVDAVSSLMSNLWNMYSDGTWRDEREANLLDGGRPYYGVYECADGRYMAVGAIEPQFYRALGKTLDIDLPEQDDPEGWPRQRKLIAAAFASRPQSHWVAAFAEVDACVSPVLSLSQARTEPHLRARESILVAGDVTQPNVTPRFSRTPGAVGPLGLPAADDLSADTLARWDIGAAEWAIDPVRTREADQ